MSLKPQYTKEQMIDALNQTMGLYALAADILGCAESTIRKYAANHPEVAEVRDKWREKRLDMAEMQLWRLIDKGNVASIIFYLKTQGKKRGYSERYEITGEDGNAIEVNNTTTLEASKIIGILSSGESSGT